MDPRSMDFVLDCELERKIAGVFCCLPSSFNRARLHGHSVESTTAKTFTLSSEETQQQAMP